MNPLRYCLLVVILSFCWQLQSQAESSKADGQKAKTQSQGVVFKQETGKVEVLIDGQPFT